MKKHEMVKMKLGQGGFTLIELLIVMAIIGILAVIAILQYQNYTVKAAERACLSDVRSFASAFAASSSDPRVPLPTVSTVLANYTDGGSTYGANSDTDANGEVAACSSITLNSNETEVTGDPRDPGVNTVSAELGFAAS